MFCSLSPPNESTIVDNINVCLTPNEICRLDKLVTASEIWDAFRQMAPNKPPGIDGMPTLFNQKIWSLIGLFVVNIAQEFYKTGVMPKDLNHTMITLILKVSGPW